MVLVLMFGAATEQGSELLHNPGNACNKEARGDQC